MAHLSLWEPNSWVSLSANSWAPLLVRMFWVQACCRLVRELLALLLVEAFLWVQALLAQMTQERVTRGLGTQLQRLKLKYLQRLKLKLKLK